MSIDVSESAVCSMADAVPRGSPVVHHLYGIRVRTPWRVGGVASVDEEWDVEFVEDDGETLARGASYVPRAQAAQWAQYAVLPDGSAYRRWSGMFEFLVTPDARRIYAQTLRPIEDEALLAYLMVDALSFSMVRLGWEPLHATAVTTEHGVAAFLGNSGDGKSTLAALLMRGGCKLVTDDMLILTRDRGTWLAQPGPPRLKLYQDMADHILGAEQRGVPMNPSTTKSIMAVDHADMACGPAPVRALYVLENDRAPGQRAVMFRRLSPSHALPRLLAHTAAHYPCEAPRLRRQFDFATSVVREIPIKSLSYRRAKREMTSLRDALLADLAQPAG
jgi:hypothetical protein